MAIVITCPGHTTNLAMPLTPTVPYSNHLKHKTDHKCSHTCHQ